VSKFDVAGTDVNLVLVAMNNARRYAERRHNWSVSRKKGYFSVTTSNKVDVTSPVWFDAGTEKMKEGKHWWLRSEDNTSDESLATDVPLKVIGQGVKHKLEAMVQYEDWGCDWADRAELRTSGSRHPLLQQAHGVVRGKWLGLYPVPDVTKKVVVDGYYWWPEWTSAAVERWSVTLPTSVFLSRNDESYLYINIQTPDETRQVVLVLDDAQDGTSVTTLSAPYAQVGAPHLSLDASGFTKTNVFNALEYLGWDVEVTTDSVTITVAGEPTTEAVQLYNSNTGVFEINTTMTPALAQEMSDLSVTSDWWTENASEFLMLRSIVEANMLGMLFVGNKEGNLPTPEKQAEKALEFLIKQDEDMEMAGGSIELY
jgi:hypothetical protein